MAVGSLLALDLSLTGWPMGSGGQADGLVGAVPCQACRGLHDALGCCELNLQDLVLDGLSFPQVYLSAPSPAVNQFDLARQKFNRRYPNPNMLEDGWISKLYFASVACSGNHVDLPVRVEHRPLVRRSSTQWQSVLLRFDSAIHGKSLLRLV
uniref:Uncharacterized protein n=1 Tax=Oryza punctata TaxID=4537 RepID=A0A0E0KXC6_ORYPU